MSEVKFQIELIHKVIEDYRSENKKNPEVIYIGTKWFLDLYNESHERMRVPNHSRRFYNIEEFENATSDSEREVSCYGVRLEYSKEETTNMYLLPFSKSDVMETYFNRLFSTTWNNVIIEYK